MARSDVVGDALEEWAKARGYVPPPVLDVVAEAAEELRDARRRSEESVRVLREMLAGTPVSEQTGHRI
ncbi:hypothetical protein [Myxococcus sp. AS-1-15]|uniref:hypothetical protein n=1 Tax=Myxococcus sp. AS-1-15 TaxID=2874600 RepID=UPI001CC13452|nr:hypothetical protein [Myxococcus sp. AS-1-15]MBZ4400406.1 hypothetical protein [Myxococcus sp. AS-1-15]